MLPMMYPPGRHHGDRSESRALWVVLAIYSLVIALFFLLGG